MKILLIAGARPNFIKIAPLLRAFQSEKGCSPSWARIGQHTDPAMSDHLIGQLGLPRPAHFVEIGQTTGQAQFFDRAKSGCEAIFRKEKPELVIVVGDVNSTLAAALAAKNTGTKLAHVEAGLRSGDRSMPEETNRIATDSLSDLHFVSEAAGMLNLANEGFAGKNAHLVGNVMIDTLAFLHKKKSIRPFATRSVSKGLFFA